jgi:hypothetical protein
VSARLALGKKRANPKSATFKIGKSPLFVMVESLFGGGVNSKFWAQSSQYKALPFCIDYNNYYLWFNISMNKIL